MGKRGVAWLTAVRTSCSESYSVLSPFLSKLRYASSEPVISPRIWVVSSEKGPSWQFSRMTFSQILIEQTFLMNLIPRWPQCFICKLIKPVWKETDILCQWRRLTSLDVDVISNNLMSISCCIQCPLSFRHWIAFCRCSRAIWIASERKAN